MLTWHEKVINQTINDKLIRGIKWRYDRVNNVSPVVIAYFNDCCDNVCSNEINIPGQCSFDAVMHEIMNITGGIGCQRHGFEKCCYCEAIETCCGHECTKEI